MDEKELEKIMEKVADKAAKKAIEAYQKEQKNAESRRAYTMTFKYLKQYGNLVSSIKNAQEIKISAAEEQENTFLQMMRKSQMPTHVIAAVLARCIQELELETKQKNKYRVFAMYFFEGKTYEQITAEIPMGDSTPRRWVSEMVSILAVKIFGVEAMYNRG